MSLAIRQDSSSLKKLLRSCQIYLQMLRGLVNGIYRQEAGFYSKIVDKLKMSIFIPRMFYLGPIFTSYTRNVKVKFTSVVLLQLSLC